MSWTPHTADYVRDAEGREFVVLGLHGPDTVLLQPVETPVQRISRAALLARFAPVPAEVE